VWPKCKSSEGYCIIHYNRPQGYRAGRKKSSTSVLSLVRNSKLLSSSHKRTWQENIHQISRHSPNSRTSAVFFLKRYDKDILLWLCLLHARVCGNPLSSSILPFLYATDCCLEMSVTVYDSSFTSFRLVLNSEIPHKIQNYIWLSWLERYFWGLSLDLF
jgi:hypothetical protein